MAALVAISFALSFVHYLPGISACRTLPTIILTVAISCAGALLFPSRPKVRG